MAFAASRMDHRGAERRHRQAAQPCRGQRHAGQLAPAGPGRPRTAGGCAWL